MMTDPIADFLIRIKNGYMAHKKSIRVFDSRMNQELVKILTKKGFIRNVKKEKEEKRLLILELIYEGSQSRLTDVVRISKPGRRVYVKKNKIPKVLGGFGFTILSTPQGILTDEDARKKGIGGELLCSMW